MKSARFRFIAFFALIALASTAVFSSTTSAGSLSDLFFGTHSAGASASTGASIFKPAAFFSTQPAPAAPVVDNEQHNDDIATVTTDRTDYNPGETVVITGSGFTIYEPVTLKIFREGVEAATYQATADGNGNFINRQFVISAEDVGALFVVKATGATSGKTADSKFTDGDMSYTTASFKFTGTTAIVSGTSGSFSQAVRSPLSQSSPCTGNYATFQTTVGVSTNPVIENGTTLSLFPSNFQVSASPSQLTFSNPDQGKTWTITIAVPASTIPGRYGAYIIAIPDSPCHKPHTGTEVVVEVKAPTPLDTTAPAITVDSGLYVNNTWTNQPVSITLNATDNLNGSGVKSIKYNINGGSDNITNNTSVSIPSSQFTIEGPYVVTYSATDNANNTSNSQNFYVNIDKTKPVITLSGDADITLLYGTAFTDPGYSATDKYFATDIAAPTNLTSNVVVTGTVNTNTVGDYTLNYNITDSAGNVADQKTRTVHVVKADQSINFVVGTKATATYGDAAFDVFATGGASGNPVTFAAKAGSTCSVTDNNNGSASVGNFAAGTCTVVASQAGNTNYNAAPNVEHVITVAKATGSISINNIPGNAVFGGTFTPEFTKTGDGAASVTSLTTDYCTVSGGVVSFVKAGQCSLKASLAAGTNHLAAEGTAQNFEIARASQTITFGTLAGKTYGDADFTVSASASSGLAVTFTANGNCTVTNGTVHITGAGSCTITASQAGDTNHLAATSVPQLFNISPKALTASVVANDKVYDGGTSATFTCSVAGKVGTEDVNCTGGTAAFDTKNVGTNKTVTVTGLGLSGAKAGNYSLPVTTTTDTADITPATVNGSFTADNKVYNGDNLATILTRAIDSGIVGTEDVTLTSGSATFDNKNVGNGKTVTGTGFSLGGVDAGNYQLGTVTTTTANITPKGLTINGAVANSRDYNGGTTATVNFSNATLSGVIVPDVVAINSSAYAANFDNKNVGTGKTVTVTGVVLSGAGAGNYSVSQPSGLTANITALHITGSFTADNKVYDRTTSANVASRSLNGAVNGDAVSLTGGTAAFDTKNVGNGKTVTLTGAALSGGDATNYVLDSVATTTANITPKTVTCSITADSKIFDGTNTATILTRTINGVILPDVVECVGGTATFDTAGTGTGKTVTATGLSISGTDAGNYKLDPTTATTTANIGAWTLRGFYQPVDMTTPTSGLVWNTVKSGSTVPLKFNIFAGDTERINTSDILSFKVFTVTCVSGGSELPVELTTTGGTSLRYSGTPGIDGQFIQNWQTPKQVGCYQVVMTAKDNSSITAYFKLK